MKILQETLTYTFPMRMYTCGFDCIKLCSPFSPSLQQICGYRFHIPESLLPKRVAFVVSTVPWWYTVTFPKSRFRMRELSCCGAIYARTSMWKKRSSCYSKNFFCYQWKSHTISWWECWGTFLLKWDIYKKINTYNCEYMKSLLKLLWLSI